MVNKNDLLLGIVVGLLIGFPLALIIFKPRSLSYENVEIIRWEDWRGRERTVTIQRKAHEV